MAEHTNEFTTAYLQDIEYLSSARRALLTHPCLGIAPQTVNSSAFRQMALAAIGTVESALKTFDKEHPVAKVYFQTGTNEDRIKKLMQALHNEFGVEANPDVLRDFLAIKQLRNAVVHSAWRKEDQKLLAEQGFPGSLDAFHDHDWQRARKTAAEMMAYLAGSRSSEVFDHWASGFQEADRDKMKAIFSLDDLRIMLSLNQPFAPLFVRKDRLDRVYWRNLEMIGSLSRFASGIQQADHEQLTEIAIESWHEFFGLLCLRESLSDAVVSIALGVLSVLHEKQMYSPGSIGAPLGQFIEAGPTLLNDGMDPARVALLKSAQSFVAHASDATEAAKCQLWDQRVQKNVSSDLVAFVLDRPEDPRPDDIAKALRVGAVVKKCVPNISAIDCLVSRIPHSTTSQIELIRPVLRSALQASKLSAAWYAYVEGHQLDSPHLDAYEKAIDELN